VTGVSFKAVDRAGNVSVKRSLTIRVDRTPRWSRAVATPLPNSVG